MSGTPGTAEEDKKPGAADQGGSHINLKVKGQDGNEVFFKIKRSTQLKKLMNAYCGRQSVEINAIAFLFDGRRLRGEQTPDEILSSPPPSPFLPPGSFACFTIGFAFFSHLYTLYFQLEMEDGDEIDVMLHQTGGYTL